MNRRHVPRKPVVQPPVDELQPAKLRELSGKADIPKLEDCSVFGAESESKINAFLKANRGDRVAAFRDFMWADLRQRVATAAGPNKSLWGDAANVFLHVFIESTREKITSGEDVNDVRNELGISRTYINYDKMEVLTRVYLAARKRFFPESLSSK
jgi:hypothetical protein